MARFDVVTLATFFAFLYFVPARDGAAAGQFSLLSWGPWHCICTLSLCLLSDAPVLLVCEGMGEAAIEASIVLHR